MSVRHFTRTNPDYITLSIGAIPAFGPATVAAVLKKSSDTSDFEYIMFAGNGGDPANWQFYIGSGGDNKPSLWLGTAELKAPFTALASEGWMMLAATKATGTVAPRYHKYLFSDPTNPTRGNSVTTGANSTAPGTLAEIGISPSLSGGAFDGHLLAIGVWNSVLNDAALDAIGPANYTSFGAMVTGWLATTPRGMWRLDQASEATAVNDLTAGGANQTAIGGTSVVNNDDPTWPSAPVTHRRGDPGAAAWILQVLES